MLTLKGLYEKVKKLDTDKVIENAFKDSVDDLAEENKKQLFEGFDRTGGKIKRKYRSNKYARVKNQMNALPGLGTPDLKVTGAFYAGIEVKLSGGVLTTHSTDSKGEFLEKNYDPFGLGGKFKKEFIDITLRPAINTRISKVIGLKFK